VVPFERAEKFADGEIDYSGPSGPVNWVYWGIAAARVLATSMNATTEVFAEQNDATSRTRAFLFAR